MGRHLEDVARHIVDCALRVHIQTGPGLLESVNEVLLARQLQKRGLEVQRQVYTDVVIDGVSFEGAFRLDMLVERTVAVEVKSVESWNAAHWKQLLTYLRLMDLRLGFLLNFGGATMKGNIKRVANRYEELAP